jgi:hypothetical protein
MEPAVSAFGVRSRKLSNISKGRLSDVQNLLSSESMLSLVSTHSISKGVDVRQAAGRKK